MPYINPLDTDSIAQMDEQEFADAMYYGVLEPAAKDCVCEHCGCSIVAGILAYTHDDKPFCCRMCIDAADYDEDAAKSYLTDASPVNIKYLDPTDGVLVYVVEGEEFRSWKQAYRFLIDELDYRDFEAEDIMAGLKMTEIDYQPPEYRMLTSPEEELDESGFVPVKEQIQAEDGVCASCGDVIEAGSLSYVRDNCFCQAKKVPIIDRKWCHFEYCR